MIADYAEACRVLLKEGRGVLRLKSGRVVSGSLCNIESKWDDPDGIGAIYLETKPGYGEVVFASEFDCLIEGGSEEKGYSHAH